jgi:hypothetical protein
MNGANDTPAANEPKEEVDEETARASAIAESRRKMADLERDRPLWEEQARLRRQREEEEAHAKHQRTQQDARRRNEEKMREEHEARTREDAARVRAEEREREERARRMREFRQQDEKWYRGSWTRQRALDRYRERCAAFDSTKFGRSDPAYFEMIPWPVLTNPMWLGIEDIDWAAVEKFFQSAKLHMRPDEYRLLLDKSHKRFHPDKWRARGVLASVVDESERSCLEVGAYISEHLFGCRLCGFTAGNTVAQALTALWADLKNNS